MLNIVSKIFTLWMVLIFPVSRFTGQDFVSKIEILEFKNLFPGYVNLPIDIEVDREGNYYVLEREEHCIKVFKSDCIFSHKIGEVGQGEGELYYPSDFCIDKNQNVYIADTGNKRIQIFSSKGKKIAGFNLKFRPYSIAVNSKGEIYVTGNVDVKNNSIISVFNKRGDILRNFANIERTKYKDDLIQEILNRLVYLYIDQYDNIYLAFEAIPKFRKYDANEKLIFERDISGKELELIVKKGGRPVADHKKEVVSNITTLVNDIKVDKSGAIFISLGAPYIYKYNKEGEKEKTYKCFFMDKKGKREEIGVFKMILINNRKIIGVSLHECIFANLK